MKAKYDNQEVVKIVMSRKEAWQNFNSWAGEILWKEGKPAMKLVAKAADVLLSDKPLIHKKDGLRQLFNGYAEAFLTQERANDLELLEDRGGAVEVTVEVTDGDQPSVVIGDSDVEWTVDNNEKFNVR